MTDRLRRALEDQGTNGATRFPCPNCRTSLTSRKSRGKANCPNCRARIELSGGMVRLLDRPVRREKDRTRVREVRRHTEPPDPQAMKIIGLRIPYEALGSEARATLLEADEAVSYGKTAPGEVAKRLASALGMKPCGRCEQRRRELNEAGWRRAPITVAKQIWRKVSGNGKQR